MLKAGIFVLTMLLVVAAVLAPAASAQTPAAGTPGADAPANYEINFLKDMSNHHAGSLLMAEKCAKEATREELRTFCQQMVTNQRQEIDQMVAALANWYGIAGYKPDPMAPMSDMAAMQSMTGAMTTTMGMTDTTGTMGNMGNMGTPGSKMQ